MAASCVVASSKGSHTLPYTRRSIPTSWNIALVDYSSFRLHILTGPIAVKDVTLFYFGVIEGESFVAIYDYRLTKICRRNGTCTSR